MQSFSFFVPSNRRTAAGKPKGMDGMNELVFANRVNRYAGAKQERENVQLVATYASVAMHKARVRAMDEQTRCKAHVSVCFVEPNQRRDVSNVYGGLKFVLDGLSRPRGSKKLGAAAIYDDSPRWVECTPSIEIGDKPGVRITITYEEER